MKRLIVVFFVAVFAGTLLGQVISVSESEVDFGWSNIYTTPHTSELTVSNNTDEEIVVTVMESSDVISVNPTYFTMSANQSQNVSISFSPVTNITYDYTVFFKVEAEEFAEPVRIIGYGAVHSKYSSTFNKWDSDLVSALSNIVANHNALSYADAQTELFGYIANESGQVRCVYTNQWFTCQPGNTPDWNLINTGHTWPINKGGSGSDERDLHHLFPTDTQVNSLKADHPFGEVVNASWEYMDSKVGTNSSGITVFEPRDSHKGDAARAMFYFVLRYGNLYNFLNSADQQTVLREWYHQDPVSTYEINRNETIDIIQWKSNPFIEHSPFLDRIASFSHNFETPRFPIVSTPYEVYNFPSTLVNEPVEISIPIANNGNLGLDIIGVQANEPQFTVLDFPASLEPGEWGVITAKFLSSSIDTYYTALTIYSDDLDSPHEISVVGHCSPVSNEDNNVELFTNISMVNHPNPFTELTTLSFTGVKQKSATIAIYNLKGQKVTNIVNNALRGGKGEIVWNGCDSEGKKLPSGIYFAKLIAGNQSTTRKILLMK